MRGCKLTWAFRVVVLPRPIIVAATPTAIFCSPIAASIGHLGTLQGIEAGCRVPRSSLVACITAGRLQPWVWQHLVTWAMKVLRAGPWEPEL